MSTSKKKSGRDRPLRNFAVMRSRSETSCVCCNKTGHRVWSCDSFKSGSVRQRWALAKEKQLCFRCLSKRHLGKDCPRAQVCGTNGCKSNHHRLLHEVVGRNQQKQNTQEEGKNSRHDTGRSLRLVPDLKGESVTSSDQQSETENRAYTTVLASSKSSKEVVSFRTVPVWLKANGQKIRVNAVLDDTSSASYVSEEVAGALGLSAPYEPVTVQVLNDSIETFETMPVDWFSKVVMETFKFYSKPLRAHDRSQVAIMWWIGSNVNNVGLIYKYVIFRWLQQIHLWMS